MPVRQYTQGRGVVGFGVPWVYYSIVLGEEVVWHIAAGVNWISRGWGSSLRNVSLVASSEQEVVERELDRG